MRWLPFFVYMSGTVVLVLIVFSDFAFGDGNTRVFLKRLGLAFVWPFAALSRSGRELLFKYGSDV